MSKYLLEIGTEELPAKFSHSVLEQFKSLIEFELDKKLIKFEQIVVTSTPRRIVLLLEGLVDYADGTNSTEEQMARDVTTFLSWAAEPELEERHRTGVKVMIYLILLTILVYLSMKRLWSRIDTEV